jgi:hydroxymethylglutaryl-CoA synthase
MFAYGSGFAASMFRLYAPHDLSKNDKILQQLTNRIKITPEEYSRRMQVREVDYQRKSFTPQDHIQELREGTVYLERVDERWKRYYNRVSHRPKI